VRNKSKNKIYPTLPSYFCINIESKGKMMKKTLYLLGIAASAVLYSCSSTYHAGSAQDDVYYSSKNQPPVTNPQPAPAPAPESYSNSNNNYDNSGSNQDNNSDQSQYNNSNSGYSNSDQSTDGKGNTYITNNYYDDYYDYEYSSRIRRFYTPAYGYGYYDPFYTNSYWYDYNPNSWGVSIYLGYNWWAPSYYYYSPFCYGGGWSVGFG
jgi:hypothetical protein